MVPLLKSHGFNSKNPSYTWILGLHTGDVSLLRVLRVVERTPIHITEL